MCKLMWFLLKQWYWPLTKLGQHWKSPWVLCPNVRAWPTWSSSRESKWSRPRTCPCRRTRARRCTGSAGFACWWSSSRLKWSRGWSWRCPLWLRWTTDTSWTGPESSDTAPARRSLFRATRSTAACWSWTTCCPRGCPLTFSDSSPQSCRDTQTRCCPTLNFWLRNQHPRCSQRQPLGRSVCVISVHYCWKPKTQFWNLCLVRRKGTSSNRTCGWECTPPAAPTWCCTRTSSWPHWKSWCSTCCRWCGFRLRCWWRSSRASRPRRAGRSAGPSPARARAPSSGGRRATRPLVRPSPPRCPRVGPSRGCSTARRTRRRAVWCCLQTSLSSLNPSCSSRIWICLTAAYTWCLVCFSSASRIWGHTFCPWGRQARNLRRLWGRSLLHSRNSFPCHWIRVYNFCIDYIHKISRLQCVHSLPYIRSRFHCSQ